MPQSERVATLVGLLNQDDNTVRSIVDLWDTWKNQMRPKLDESLELRNFIFATDTGTTSVAESLGEHGWKNNTHLPKICEIRDNLLAVYKASWFPNDNWMKWEAFKLDDETIAKKEAIEAYMQNKVKMSDFERVLGDKCAADFLDYGNAFIDTDWRDDRVKDKDGIVIKEGYVGPIPVRISPEDIAFDITAASFVDAPKIRRKIMTLGDLAILGEKLTELDPEQSAVIKESLKTRRLMSKFSVDDFNKAQAYVCDGFGSYHEYLKSGYVEVLEFRGSLYSTEDQKLKQDQTIQILDRRVVLKQGPWDSWLRDGGVYHVPWRDRNDSLWGMGPFDNLVGMQYRVDHLQGAKDDNIDLHLHPTKVIIGDPEETAVGPDKEIRLEEGESIHFQSPDLSAFQIDQEIQYLLQLMEEFAGSPRQSRGFRTPGEKTLGEVSLLESNSNKIFLDKTTKFEKELIEPALNGMLEIGRRNLQGSEATKVFDDTLGVFIMLDINEKDLQAEGLLRPIGARHFGQRNQQLTNLINLSNSNLWPKVEPHFSGLELSKLINDNLQLSRFGLISDYAALHEQGEAARVGNQVQREVADEAAQDPDGEPEELLDAES